jgi:hypothetical protein
MILEVENNKLSSTREIGGVDLIFQSLLSGKLPVLLIVQFSFSNELRVQPHSPNQSKLSTLGGPCLHVFALTPCMGLWGSMCDH